MKLVFGQTGSRIATVRVTFDAGTAVEYGGKWTSGIAHLSEHMFFQGSKSMSHTELTRVMASLGVSWNAFTSHSKVSFFISAPHENIVEATKIFSELFHNRELKQDAFEKEKLVVLEEERGSHDDVDGKIFEQLDRFLCNGPMAELILGTRDSIQSIELDEVKAFCDQYYTEPRMLVTITSPDPDHERLGELFGKSKKTFKRSERAANEYTKRKRLNVLTNIQQSRVFVCYPMTPIKHKNTLDIQFMEHFFSQGMDSRLFQVLRQEHGLCYAVGSSPLTYEDIGWLVIWTNTNMESVNKSLKLIDKEIKTLLEKGPTKEEMIRARNKFISEVYSRLESSYGLNTILDYRAFNSLPPIDASVNRIKRMTPGKVMAAAREVFVPKARQIFTCMPKEE